MKRILAACLLMVGGSSVITGQAPALPSAADLIAKHVTAIGGANAFKAIASMNARGRMEIPSQSLSGTLEIWSARPNKLVTRVDFAGEGRVESGYDGKVGWTIDPQSGPAVMSGQRLVEMIDDARFDGTLHPADHIKTMTTVAKTTFDKRDAYKVHIVYASGREQDEFFDAEHGWQLGWEGQRQTQMGLVPSSTIVRDYKKFGALMQATTLVERALGFEAILKITSYTYDMVPTTAFDLPAAIKKLVGR